MHCGNVLASSSGATSSAATREFRRGRRLLRRHLSGFQADRATRWRFGWYRRRLRSKPMSLMGQPFAARQRRPGPTEPGDIDGGMVPRVLTYQQVAPEFDRGLGLLDILEKGEFGVITAPAAGLEQFGEVIEPLLGKSAPAPDNVATARHVQSMCHEPARRRKTDADATGTNQLDATGIFCGKLLHCPVNVVTRAASSTESRENWGLSSLLTVKPHAGMAELRCPPARGQRQYDRFRLTEMPEISAKTKDPSGGTTGRVKLYGRLGWMGARAKYSLDGEGLPLPPILVAGGAPHVQTTGDFFNAFDGVFGAKTKA